MGIQTVSALLFGAGLAAATQFATCKEVTFSVSGSTFNYDLSGLNLTDPAAIPNAIQNAAFGLVPVSGSQSLSAYYCQPILKNANSDKLQVLFHGITGNRDYWSALGGTGETLAPPPFQPDYYSWVEYATNLGYPTLAVDRLGAGKSSHPDPILVVQGPYEFVLYHDLAKQIRAGAKQLGKAYSDLTYVGHSYGSEIGNSLAHLFPDDWTRFVLTGFTKSVLPSLPGVTLQTPAPAALVNPAKFGTLPLGYVTAPVEQTHTDSFFGSHAQAAYDPNASHDFFVTEDVVSVGQFISTYFGTITGAPEYHGRVLVLTGEEDQAFCGPGSPVIGEAHCGSLLPDTKSLFPNADYNWHSVPQTGHAINLHYSAPSAFQVAYQFVAGASFAG